MLKLFICALALFEVNSFILRNLTSNRTIQPQAIPVFISKEYETSLFDDEADITIESDDERIIEIFKSNLNDNIFEDYNEKEYSQLKWYSYGSPKLIVINDTFLYSSQTGFYILIQMLSRTDRSLITDAINDKYKIRVKQRQIVNILPDKFVCSFEINCHDEMKRFFGSANDKRKMPLMIDFKLANKTDKQCLAKISSKLNDLIVFSCNLTIMSKQSDEDEYHQRELGIIFKRKIDLMPFNVMLMTNQTSLVGDKNEFKVIMSKLDRLEVAASKQESLIKNLTDKFRSFESEILSCKKESEMSNRLNQTKIYLNPNCTSNNVVKMILVDMSSYLTSLAELPNNSLAIASSDDNVFIWNLKHGLVKETLKRELSGYISSIVLLDDGHLASGSHDKSIVIWNYSDNSVIKILSGHSHYVTSLAALPNSHLASGSADKTVIIWNTDNGSIIQQLNGHDGTVSSLAVLPNNILASGSNDCKIILWNKTDGSLMRKLKGHYDEIISLAALPNGNLASGSMDKTIILWNINDGSIYQKLVDLPSKVYSLAVLPNGNLASGLDHGTINIWNMSDGSLINTLRENVGPVKSLITMSNGNLASIGSDGFFEYIIIWNKLCT